MRIHDEQFDRCIRGIETTMQADELGLFGPGSMVWRIDRESVLMLAGGRAALLQVAHPYVAWAVTSQSDVMTDVAGRFQRTFDNVFAMTFGTRSDAIRRARRVREIHKRVHGVIDEDVGQYRRGDRYDALDEGAAFWVAATLWDSSIMMFELAFGPLSQVDKERYYAESKRFAALFGLEGSALPADWSAFQAYMNDMLTGDVLAVGSAARDVAGHILRAPRRTSIPAYRWLASFTAGLLPPQMREDFGLPWGRRDRWTFQSSRRLVRLGVGALPPQLRFFPGYLDARRRVDGCDGRDPVGELVERLVLRGLARSG